MRLRGEIEKPLAVQTSTDLIAVQIWGGGDVEVRGTGGSATKMASLVQGDAVRITEGVMVIVPGGVTVDVLVIPGD